tara:strand:+ start:292 stop:1032 length:741 start_codon:yes stop_codon:yes gene_type:complete
MRGENSMTQKILAISGHKRAGKTTCVNFLHGYELQRNQVVKKFGLNERGQLLVNATFIDEKGEETEKMGRLDLDNREPRFVEYCTMSVWPFIKSYNFADALKSIAINFFGLTYEQCYGSEKDKSSPSPIKGYTAREFLQYFGTDVCRSLKKDVWVDFCINQIKSEQSALALVGDCRFPDEVEAIQKAGGKVIRLTRTPHDDSHASEIALDTYEGFDAIIHNEDMNVDEQSKELLNILMGWGWLESA